jgi:hypothetical protein
MQKIRLAVATVGYKVGALVVVSDETAAELVANRQASLVGDPIEPEPEPDTKSGKKK